MNKTTIVKLARGACAVAAVLGLVTACGSPPKPAHPDGNTRVPVNDMTRIDRLKQQSANEQALVAERQAMKDEITLLRTQIETLRKALQVIVNQPEAADAIRNAYPQPKGSMATPPAAQPGPASSAAPAPLERRSETDTTLRLVGGPVDDGLVFRFFHHPGDTRFEPDPTSNHRLLTAAREASEVVVWGRTDGAARDEVSEQIAIGRAVHARVWLIANGVDRTRIRVRYTSAGHYLADHAPAATNHRSQADTRRDSPKDTEPTKG